MPLAGNKSAILASWYRRHNCSVVR